MKLSSSQRNRKLKSVGFQKKCIYSMVGLLMSGCTLVYAKESSYAEGQGYLDSKDWKKAQSAFSQVVKDGSGKQDAAMYWLAYAYQKGGNNQKALNTIERIVVKYPESKWVDDALALQAEIKDELGEAGDISDDEMKLYAIDSLMNASEERAYAVLSKILKSNNSTKIKKRALFVLSQTDSENGFNLVSEIAQNESDLGMQLVAIEMLGISGEKAGSKVLRKIVAQSSNNEVKRKALDGLMLADDHQGVVEIAGGLTGELKSHAIHLMGVMGQSVELSKLYTDKRFSKNKLEIIEAISIDDGFEQLAKIIEIEKDESLRLSAIERLGIMNAKHSATLLDSIYQKSNSEKDKAAVIKALFIQSNAKALIKIAKNEKNNKLKREVIRHLSMIESDETVEFFNQVLEQE